ncbi:MAG: hypothetical protein H0U66_14925 [Gemmatimonadaceae bacterium]|nr:hypothetical protein [Gemmatimonadaceae bacterium]
MYRLGLTVAVTGLALLTACSTSDTPVSPPSHAGTDTLVVADPTGSPSTGVLHFNLTRSSTSLVPATADSALVRVRNTTSGFDETFAAKIPTPGATTVVSVQVPADTGYVVAVAAFHGDDVLDAVGSSSDNDTTITVFPEGNPVYTATPVHISMQAAPFDIGYSIDDGTHVVAGTHIGWQAGISAPFDIWTGVTSSWGCQFNGNQCAVYREQSRTNRATG